MEASPASPASTAQQPRPPTAAALRSLPAQMVAAEDRSPRQEPTTPATNPNAAAAPESSWWERLKRSLPCRSGRVDVALSTALARES
ncbi:unnamed protein product [Caenorhabditis brenneri]